MLYKTHVVVHLQNIKDNILKIKEKAKGRKILIAVKADAYGHGAITLCNYLQDTVDWFGVATTSEGIEIRKAGFIHPILKFSPAFEDEIVQAVRYEITLPVICEDNAKDIEKIASWIGKKVPIHIKVDTGMGRVGVLPENLSALLSFILKNCPHLYIEGMMTHFPISDNPKSDFTSKQIQLFKKLVKESENFLGRKIDLVHAANSGAILGFEEAFFDMVRPGIMIYGYYPDADNTPRTIPLKRGLSFYTAVSFIKKVKKGTPISYGCTWKAPKDTYIGTIPVGYADGFNRLFSNKGKVLINGRFYPIVGRVCMDQSMINLGEKTDVKVGDKVVLIGESNGKQITADDWAKQLNTISYEITCRIDKRVSRIYPDLKET